MKIGLSEIDFDAHEINGPSGTVTVEPKVMQVLAVLVENAGEVVTRESLIDQVWGVGFGGDERLSRAISLLRKSLGDTSGKPTYIQTIPRRGYKLTLDQNPNAEDASVGAELSPKPNKRNSLVAVILGLISIIGGLFFITASGLFDRDEPPLVIVMDSAHPARVYDEEIRSTGGTNADILSDIFADLPVRTQKELISPNWNRYEAILQFDPDLIVIHYSGFKQEDASGDRPKLRLLAEYFDETDTRFLIYSRAGHDWLDHKINMVLEDLYARNPDLKSRVDIYPLLEYGDANWMDQASALGIKIKVKQILDLE